MSRMAVAVSSVSRPGSISVNSRPKDRPVLMPSEVSSRYSVVSGPAGSRSVQVKSGMSAHPRARFSMLLIVDRRGVGGRLAGAERARAPALQIVGQLRIGRAAAGGDLLDQRRIFGVGVDTGSLERHVPMLTHVHIGARSQSLARAAAARRGEVWHSLGREQ